MGEIVAIGNARWQYHYKIVNNDQVEEMVATFTARCQHW